MTVSPTELDGQTLVLLLMGTDEGDDDDWVLFFGVAEYDGTQLLLNRGEGHPPFVIRDEWLDRIAPVPDGTEEIFNGAHYYLALTVGALPEGVHLSAEGYDHTELRWPSA